MDDTQKWDGKERRQEPTLCSQHVNIEKCLKGLEEDRAVRKALNEARDKMVAEIRDDIKELTGKLDTYAREHVPLKHYRDDQEKIHKQFLQLAQRIEEVNEETKKYTLKLLTTGLVLASALFSLIQLLIQNGIS